MHAAITVGGFVDFFAAGDQRSEWFRVKGCSDGKDVPKSPNANCWGFMCQLT